MDPRDLLKKWSDKPEAGNGDSPSGPGPGDEAVVVVATDSEPAVQTTPTPSRPGRKKKLHATDGTRIARSNASLQEKLDRLQLLHDVARQFVQALDLDELMQTIFKRIIEVLDAQAGSMWLKDPKKGDLVCQVAEGPEKDKVLGLRIPVGTGVVGWAVEKNKSALVKDTAKDSRFSKAADRRTGFETKSMITCPLAIGSEVLGAVQVINKVDEKLKFDDDDLGLLEDIATYAAISIKNARLYESQQKIKELSALLTISKEITSTLDLDRVLVSVVNMANEVVDYERAAIALEDNGRARIAAISGESTVDPAKFADLAEVLGWCLTREKELWIPDAEAYAQVPEAEAAVTAYFKKRPDTRALWIKPLKDEEGLVGIMAMESSRKDFIPREQFEVLSILTNQTTVALRNAQLYHRVPLVGVWDKFGGKGSWWGRKAAVEKVLWAMVFLGLVWAIFFVPNPWSSISCGFEVLPSRKAVVYAGVGGTVERIYKREGDAVAAGEAIASFDTRDLAVGLETSRFALERARAELVKDSSSLAPDPIKRNEYLRLQRDIALTRDKLERARARSPMDGVLLTPGLEDLPGKVLKEGDELGVVADLRKVLVEIAVGESDLRFIRVGAPVSFKTSAYRDRTFSGLVRELAPEAVEKDDGSIVFPARVEIDNPADGGAYLLKPGMSGRAVIAVEPMTIFDRLLHAFGWR